MISKNITSFLILLLFSIVFVAEADMYIGGGEEFDMGSSSSTQRDIGEFGYPNDPMSDRAEGLLLKGKVKNAVSNFGDFINWYFHPAGLWGEYTYLPDMAMIAGVRGHRYSSEFTWVQAQMNPSVEEGPSSGYGYQEWYAQYGNDIDVWCSEDLYDSWNLDQPELYEQDSINMIFYSQPTIRVKGKYIGMVFETEDDRGTIGIRKIDGFSDLGSSLDAIARFDAHNQWAFDFHNAENNGSSISRVCISTRAISSLDPNNSNAMLGVMYPWGLRPKLKERKDEFDLYEFGVDGHDWTEDDLYMYYGANVAESWMTRIDPSYNTDWHASTEARLNTHGTDVNSADIFADTPFRDSQDTYPLLAHSAYSQTWPEKFEEEAGEWVSYWPGWYSQGFNPDLPGCDGDRLNDLCWEEVEGRFTSDNDVYMEFDDRWAHRGNMVDTNNEYKQTGYPMGVRVKSTAHSYGVSFAEDIMFVTVWVHNQSDDMIMPDGTKLNRGQGFDYEDMSIGFYMDADVLTMDMSGSYAPHTNDDDFMEYVDCLTSTQYYPDGCPVINDEELRVSIAIIGDWDGESNAAMGYSMDPDVGNPGTDFGLVAVQMLDSPPATEEIDLNQDGFINIYPGEKLKMTDWHWFSWYTRPGVTHDEESGSCCAGDSGKEQARNKEEIQYKVMRGDTTNLSSDEQKWYFHADPALDTADPMFNPHFDNVEDLKQTDFFQSGSDGLDCVMKMTCGPFDLAVQDSVPFSFCIIYGQNMNDLLANAEFAQVMYNAKYQGFTPPSTSHLEAEVGDEYVKLYWDQAPDSSNDVVTGYFDFEGYKIYKSTDGGINWGDESGKVYDNTGIHVGWQPITQFDLSYEEDYYHCVKQAKIGNCDSEPIYGEAGSSNATYDTYRHMDVSGFDPQAPWLYLGSNTGMPTEFDQDLDSGEECTDHDGDASTPPHCRYYYIDRDVLNGMEYTYSIVAYDMGIADTTQLATVYTDPFPVPDANPDDWARTTNGYQNIEAAKGTTILDENFVTIIPGPVNTGTDCNQSKVVPNPYFARSGLNETEYNRRIAFMDLPEKYILKIFTITGEFVWEQDESHQDAGDGMAFWDLRTINNQEVSPGLYLYTLEVVSEYFTSNPQFSSSNPVREVNCRHIGKFAIVR